MEGMSATKSALVAGRGMKLAPPPITKSDEAFASENIEFVFGGDLNIEELNDLFEKVGLLYLQGSRVELLGCGPVEGVSLQSLPMAAFIGGYHKVVT